MTSRNQSALERPIIGRVIALNKRLLQIAPLAPKRVQRIYVATILNNARLLFTYAMRQINGKDHKKRAIELVEEIQADAYIVYSIGGWSKKTVLSIDIMCDEIFESIISNDASVIKSKDEDK